MRQNHWPFVADLKISNFIGMTPLPHTAAGNILHVRTANRTDAIVTPEPIRCCDGCGAAVVDVSDAEAKGWTRLQITGRNRYPTCVREFDAIDALRGGDE